MTPLTSSQDMVLIRRALSAVHQERQAGEGEVRGMEKMGKNCRNGKTKPGRGSHREAQREEEGREEARNKK